MINLYRSPVELRQKVGQWRRYGLRVALVPTMGALHDGHLTLVQQAQMQADKVVATIFVNPTQFGYKEDFPNYPRQESMDIEALEKISCDGVYIPTPEQMYPCGYQTSINVGGALAETLDGACRPGHFQGVATVVCKLLLQSLPDVALFGEKDWQQLMVIVRMVRDLDVPVEICGVETVREEDGLALSSRNRYLSPEERAVAPILYSSLSALQDGMNRGESGESVDHLIKEEIQKILAAGFSSVDYLAVCDPFSLEPWREGAARILVAAYLGKTRLIDNLAVD